MTTREVKRAFNVEFAEMEAEKQKFLDKIGGINSRIADIRLELKGHTDDAGPLFEPIVSPLERENYVLSVEDDEISAEKWLSAEERATLEAAEEAERERIRAKGANPPEDRALKDMMGGRLEKAEEGGVPDELPKPDWMVEIPREEWNDEQRKQGREFENKAKVYCEELAKRRAALAIEPRARTRNPPRRLPNSTSCLGISPTQRRRRATGADGGGHHHLRARGGDGAGRRRGGGGAHRRRARGGARSRRRRRRRSGASNPRRRAYRDASTRATKNQKLEREFRRDFAEADDSRPSPGAADARLRTDRGGRRAPETARRRAGREAVDDSAAGTRLGEAAAGHPRRCRSVPARTRCDAALVGPARDTRANVVAYPRGFVFKGASRSDVTKGRGRYTIRSTALWAGWRRIRRVGRAPPWSPWTNGTIAPRIATIGGDGARQHRIGRLPRRRNCETQGELDGRNAARSNSPRRTRWRSPRRRRSSPRRRRTPRDASIAVRPRVAHQDETRVCRGGASRVYARGRAEAQAAAERTPCWCIAGWWSTTR